MLLAAKIALGCGAGLVLMTAYTFRQGVIRIDADENRPNGSHVHLWFPAAGVTMAMHMVPSRHFSNIGEEAQRFMPVLHAIAKELDKYPEAELMEIQDGPQHARVRTHNGSLLVDVDEPDEHVHVACPLATIDDVAKQLAAYAPAS
jgi:hypothetical protein